MKEENVTESWISMRDYALKGVRKKKLSPIALEFDTSCPIIPKTWISAWDYWQEGVRKVQSHRENERSLHQPNADNTVPSSELRLTVYDALSEVFSVFSTSPILKKIDKIRVFNKYDLDSDLITSEEHCQRNLSLDEIRDSHCTHIDATVSWYLDTFFYIPESDNTCTLP